MTERWSRSGGWESFQAWKRWYLREWGRVDPPPPQRPSVRLFGAYRVFSAPEGIQTEVEVTGVDPAAMAAAKREVRWRAQAFLRKLQGYLPDSDHYALPAVVLQSRPAPARRPRPPGATWPGAAAPAGRPCSQALGAARRRGRRQRADRPAGRPRRPGGGSRRPRLRACRGAVGLVGGVGTKLAGKRSGAFSMPPADPTQQCLPLKPLTGPKSAARLNFARRPTKGFWTLPLRITQNAREAAMKRDWRPVVGITMVFLGRPHPALHRLPAS
jgi:hypothetical protein